MPKLGEGVSLAKGRSGIELKQKWKGWSDRDRVFPACVGTPKAGATSLRTAASTIAGWSKL